jgi:hypothetical protein
MHSSYPGPGMYGCLLHAINLKALIWLPWLVRTFFVLHSHKREFGRSIHFWPYLAELE